MDVASWVSLKIRESARAAKFQRPLKAHSLGTDEEIFQLQQMYNIKKQEKEIEENLKKLGYVK